jgi:hypothetical protein
MIGDKSRSHSLNPLDQSLNECNRPWLLKNSIFQKSGKIWGIENV